MLWVREAAPLTDRATPRRGRSYCSVLDDMRRTMDPELLSVVELIWAF